MTIDCIWGSISLCRLLRFHLRDFSALVLLVAVFGVHQRVPLGNRATRCGQHVRPVAQLGAGGCVAEHHFADRFRCSNAIVINHGDDQLHFLHARTHTQKKRREPEPRAHTTITQERVWICAKEISGLMGFFFGHGSHTTRLRCPNSNAYISTHWFTHIHTHTYTSTYTRRHILVYNTQLFICKV